MDKCEQTCNNSLCDWLSVAVSALDHLRYDHMRQLWLVSGVRSTYCTTKFHTQSTPSSFNVNQATGINITWCFGKLFLVPLVSIFALILSWYWKFKSRSGHTHWNDCISHCHLVHLVYSLLIYSLILYICFISGAVFWYVATVNNWRRGR